MLDKALDLERRPDDFVEAMLELVLECLEVRLHELGEYGADLGADLVVLADDFVEFVEVTLVLVFLDEHGLGGLVQFDAVALEQIGLANQLKDHGVEVDNDEFLAVGARDSGKDRRQQLGLVVLDGG